MTARERYGLNAPVIGPCSGECGVPGRGRSKPCYPTSDGWFCHDCVQTRQREIATRLEANDVEVVLPDGGADETDTDRECPVCGDSYNAELRVDELTTPDEGDWCYTRGVFFVHEKLVWKSDSENPDVERCQACGYSEDRHPMEFPEAPPCEGFQP